MAFGNAGEFFDGADPAVALVDLSARTSASCLRARACRVGGGSGSHAAQRCSRAGWVERLGFHARTAVRAIAPHDGKAVEALDRALLKAARLARQAPGVTRRRTLRNSRGARTAKTALRSGHARFAFGAVGGAPLGGPLNAANTAAVDPGRCLARSQSVGPVAFARPLAALVGTATVG